MENLERKNELLVYAMNSCTIITLSCDMKKSEYLSLIKMVGEIIENRRNKNIVIDLKPMKVMDTYCYKMLIEITDSLHVMGGKIIWCNLCAGVVVSFMDLDLYYDEEKVMITRDIDEALVIFGDDYNGDHSNKE